MRHYLEDAKKVIASFDSNENGLSKVEAEKRLEKNGKNKLVEAKKEGIIKKFLKQLADPMTIVLLFAAALSAITVLFSNEGESFADVFIILFVVILNAVLGVIQESKAEEAIEALKVMTAATSKVLRDGKIELVKSEDIVVGDIVILEAGDSVPADGRIIECASMKIEESALTGESVPAEKISDKIISDGEITAGDRKNMVFMGSTVVYGRGKVVITDVGMQTEMGKIANVLAEAKEEKTPLQQKLAGLSKVLTWLVLIICVIMFVVGIIKDGEFTTEVVLDKFMVAVSLAVAAIPEGLATVVTIVLSIGVTKMSKQNAVIRKLTAVETLGCAQVICSDKTGTLTQNKMTVVDEVSSDQKMLALIMSLCSDAEYDVDKNTAIGEPTECALVNYAYKLGYDKNQSKVSYPRIGEAPFDSMRKMMSTVHEFEGKYLQCTKGAPDEILKRCKYILKDGIVHEITNKDIEEIRNSNKNMADNALRVLAGAYRLYNDKLTSFEQTELECDMIFAGLYGMIDPIRPEVKAAADRCKDAGIKVVMITGDHIDTAIAIAKELGILTNANEAIMGQELDSMSDEELDKVIDTYSVYARVQPEHKVRIVSAWKKRGKVTAMTGDGVNDAPSIKTADIGIGMGITGTDVTKNVADMILADDNFATIVSAVDEGRMIYSNIRKSIQFLLSSNLSEVVAVFVATMLGFEILLPIHMLWINLITDSLPALALGMEPKEKDSMKKAPRDPKEGIFANGVGIDVVYQGILVALLTIAGYFIGYKMGLDIDKEHAANHGMTIAFITLSMAEIFHSFNVRLQNKSLFTSKSHNKFIWGAAIIAFVLTTAVIYVPGVNDLFHFTNVPFVEYAIGIGLAFAIIPLVEFAKIFQRLAEKKDK